MDTLIKNLEQRNLEGALKVLENNPDIFKNISSQKRDQLMFSLDFKIHSLVILGILDEYRHSPQALELFNKFMCEFDYSQIRLRFRAFYDLCRSFVNHFQDNKIGIKAVKPLKVESQKLS